MKDNLNRILWGIVLVLLGLVWGINALGIMHIDLFFNGWWTFFIIVPCFISLFDTSNNSKISSLIGLVFGIMLLLASLDVFGFDIIWKLFMPALVVIIGLSLIFGGKMKKKIDAKIKEMNKDDLEAIVATFGENFVSKKDEKFNGAALDSVFGSITLDLRGAKLGTETVIKASSIFGGIDIIVPEGVEIKVKSTPIFGGVSNNNKTKEAKKVIYIDAFCLFGGIDIK